jgi:hypothetical protein
MYRLLETHGESRERRDQLTHPLSETGLDGHVGQSVMELGHHQASRSSEVDRLGELVQKIQKVFCASPLEPPSDTMTHQHNHEFCRTEFSVL